MVCRPALILLLLLLASDPRPSQGFSDGSPSSHNYASDDPQQPPDDELTATITSHPFLRSFPCHYSTVGFPLGGDLNHRPTTDDISQLCKEMVQHPACRIFPSPVNQEHTVVQWASSCGAELWGGFDKSNSLSSGPDPHFFGLSRVQMELTKKLERQDNDEAMFCGEAFPTGTKVPDQEEKIYRDEEGIVHFNMGIQMELDCPAYQRCGKELQVPSTAEQEEGKMLVVPVQVAAFAHEIKIYDCLEAYDAMNDKKKEEGRMLFSSKSFTNMGNLSKDLDKKLDKEYPRPSEALLTGHVLQSQERINEYTGEVYYWALVETAGEIELDVVIHPRLLDYQNPPRVGSIVEGVFFLSAHFFPDKKY